MSILTQAQGKFRNWSRLANNISISPAYGLNIHRISPVVRNETKLIRIYSRQQVDS